MSDHRSEAPLPAVPVGMEHLITLAATNEPFAEALLRDPETAAAAAGVQLSGAERSMLGAVSRDSLAQMIRQVDARLPQPDRRAFFERAAAAAALLVGGASLAACDENNPPAPQHPPPRQPDSRPDDRTNAPTGSRPDRPPPRPRDAGASPISRGIRSDRPRPRTPEVSAGARAPDMPLAGVRPVRERPRERNTKGGVRPK